MNTEAITKSEVIEKLEALNAKEFSRELNKEVEALKSDFYRLDKELYDEALNKFIEEGGEKADFEMTGQTFIAEFKAAFEKHKERKDAFNKALDAEETANKKKKEALIQELKTMTELEQINKEVFDQLAQLQEKWNAITVLKAADAKELWGEYNYLRDLFYNNVSINRELRELDFQKNLEAKEAILEKTIALAAEENIQKMNDSLQFYHEEWKAIGPVKKEISDEIWDKFSEASKVCHKKRQDHYDAMYAKETENLKLKEALCEKLEAYVAENKANSVSDWNKSTDAMLAMQAEWKTIGFSGKDSNNAIWERYRAACDGFFDKKSDFFKEINKVRGERKSKKQALVDKVEALKDSEDWGKTTKAIISIQGEWKQIGDAGRHNEAKLWKAFRAACDYFFDKKKAFNSSKMEEETANLEKKEAILMEMEAYKPSDNKQEVLDQLKKFSSDWNSIGHVPFKSKDAVYKKFKGLLDGFYDGLKLADNERVMEQFKAKFGGKVEGENSNDQIRNEKTKLNRQKRELQDSISSMEANMVLISKSKGADLFRKEVEKNKRKAEDQLKAIQEKLEMIKKFEQEA